MSWLGSLAGGLGGLLGKSSGFLSNPVVNVAAHLTGAGALTDMINGANALANKLGGSAGLSDQQKLLALAALQQQQGQGQTDGWLPAAAPREFHPGPCLWVRRAML